MNEVSFYIISSVVILFTSVMLLIEEKINTQDSVIVLAILIGGPIVIGITFYFIDELLKSLQKYKDQVTARCRKRRER